MEVICACCGRCFTRNPRNPKQTYCSRPECQRMRKTLWQRDKMVTDEAYRLNHKASQQEWIRKNPGYWKAYRKRNPDKRERNRVMQLIRNKRKHKPQLIAKMDALGTRQLHHSGDFYLVPVIAKMDALKVRMFAYRADSDVIAKKDSMEGNRPFI